MTNLIDSLTTSEHSKAFTSHGEVISRFLRAIGWGVCILSLSSCGEPQEKLVPIKVGTLEFDSVMDFVKGVNSSYPIIASLPDRNDPEVSIEPLPDGAVFEANTLSWTPSCQLSQKDGYFYRGYTVFHVDIIMKGATEQTMVTRQAALLVHEKQEGVSPCSP